MRTLRLTMYFVIGVLLSVVTCFSYAETLTLSGTVTRYRYQDGGNACTVTGSSQSEACSNISTCTGIIGGNTKEQWDIWQTTFSFSGSVCVATRGINGSVANLGPADPYNASPSCPVGQNWTQNGLTCTRPDCVSPQVRDPADGVCKAPTCPTTEQGSGWYSMGVNDAGISGQYCVNGCQVTLAADLSQPYFYESATKRWRKYSGYGDGVACSSGSGLPSSSPTAPTVPEKSPPCAPGDNVIGKSTGGVNCVPSTTPDSDTPKVKKEEKKETYPDGSEKTVTTTETCNGTNSCSTTTVTNVTNNSSGQPGQAGTPGTTTGTGSSKDGTATEENPDICAANPNLQICKGGMSEEATQKRVLQELERFNNPGATDDSALQIKAATAIADNQVNKDLDTEIGKHITGEKTDGSIEGQKGAWASAMSSGWIDPIELGGCAPIVSNFADKVWILDVCPTAAKISEIGAYAMWFLLAVGAFVMVTGGKQG